MIVHRSALVECPAHHMFDLIEAAEHYPQFLPWCAGARIVSRDDSQVSADLRVRYAGLNFEVRTRNPKRRPEHMTIHLERGPFRRFEGEWKLRALSDQACKVDFTLDCEFANRMVTQVAGPVFDRLANAMVDAFVNRALVLPVQAQVPPAVPAAVPVLSVQSAQSAAQQALPVEPVDLLMMPAPSAAPGPPADSPAAPAPHPPPRG